MNFFTVKFKNQRAELAALLVVFFLIAGGLGYLFGYAANSVKITRMQKQIEKLKQQAAAPIPQQPTKGNSR